MLEADDFPHSDLTFSLVEHNQNLTNIKSEYKTKVYNINKIFPCMICPAKYSSKFALTRHFQAHNEMEGEVTVGTDEISKVSGKRCKICKRYVMHMKPHLMTVHSSEFESGTFGCHSNVPITFHNVPGILHYCDLCNFSSKYSNNVKTHMNTVSLLKFSKNSVSNFLLLVLETFTSEKVYLHSLQERIQRPKQQKSTHEECAPQRSSKVRMPHLSEIKYV